MPESIEEAVQVSRRRARRPCSHADVECGGRSVKKPRARRSCSQLGLKTYQRCSIVRWEAGMHVAR